MSIELVQKLRAQTGSGLMDVKKALDEAEQDYDKALELLRKRGEAIALKKASREATEGIIISYIHMNRIGVLVELNCETDFVARTDDFQELGKDLAMQVASMRPQYVATEDVPEAVQKIEREIYFDQIKEDKPLEIKQKIVDGKMKKFFEDVCLMNQTFFKNEDQTIQDRVTEAIGKLGENIKVRRFVRFSLDEHESN